MNIVQGGGGFVCYLTSIYFIAYKFAVARKIFNRPYLAPVINPSKIYPLFGFFWND